MQTSGNLNSDSVRKLQLIFCIIKLNRGISILMQTGKKAKILLNKRYIFQFSLLVKILYSYVKHTERKNINHLTVKNHYLPLLFVMDLPRHRAVSAHLQLFLMPTRNMSHKSEFTEIFFSVQHPQNLLGFSPTFPPNSKLWCPLHCNL